MKCKSCGGEAREIGGNRYRCKYCSCEFENPVVLTDFSAPAPEQENRDFILGNPFGSGDFVNGANAFNQLDTFSQSSNVTASSSGSTGVLSGEEIYDVAINGVVEIYACDDDGNGASSSGFVVSDRGFVLTNAHAVLDESGNFYKNVIVKAQSGEYFGVIVAAGQPADGENDSIDLCLLFVKGLNVKPNPFGDVSKLRNGQRVYLIGNSLGSGTCITSGIISDKERAIEGLSYPYIMTDAAANPGNSGGPLYNEHGEIIGVLVAGIDGAKGMNYAIPADVVAVFLSYVLQALSLADADLGELNKFAKAPVARGFDASTALSGLKLFLEVVLFILPFL